MRLAGKYILTLNAYNMLFKCNKVISRKKHNISIKGDIVYRGYRYDIICDIYRENKKECKQDNENVYLYLDNNKKPLDWKFLTKQEFFMELL